MPLSKEPEKRYWWSAFSVLSTSSCNSAPSQATLGHTWTNIYCPLAPCPPPEWPHETFCSPCSVPTNGPLGNSRCTMVNSAQNSNENIELDLKSCISKYCLRFPKRSIKAQINPSGCWKEWWWRSYVGVNTKIATLCTCLKLPPAVAKSNPADSKNLQR